MTPKEHLIACVKALCAKHGGADEVAAKAGVSAEGLQQVLDGRKLPSGQPRGIGPGVQAKLDLHYPGWSLLPSPAGPAKIAASDLEAAIGVIAAAFEQVGRHTRKAGGSLLASLAESPGEAEDIGAQLRALLSSGKRQDRPAA